MKKQKASAFFISLFFFLLLCGSRIVYATDVDDNRPVITGRRTCDDAVYVYIDGAGNAQNVTVQLGSEPCTNVKWSHMNLRRRTLLLLDNSLSMSQHWKKQSLELMNKLIDDHAPDEEFMVATFSTEINKLSSYTGDYAELKSIISGIEFANQKSYLTDVLYELLKEVVEGKESTFYRFVIIADGADDNAISYTEDELRDLIRKAGVPLYSVGVYTGANAEPLQTLFSWSRLSSIEPVKVDKSTDPSSVMPQLHADPLCVRIVPDISMQDGGTREARIIVDGVVLTTTLQLPFASDWDRFAEEATPTPEEATPTPEEVTPTPEEEPEWEESDEDEEKKGSSILLPIVIGGTALVLILTAVVIILLLKRKKNEEEEPLPVIDIPVPEPVTPPDNIGPTQMIDPGIGGSGSGRPPTVNLWSASICLTDSNDPSRYFRLPITDRILIGRKAPADLVLDFDKAVSARHCMISRIDGRYYLRDLGSSNHTYYEGMMVTEEVLIQNGGHIRIGHGDYIFQGQG
ncbi:MAG: FHA domain-containing protein [Lachnospiraceae bacterium]|nr:FHA domain-containing protein [Lachnospiraceae bacterium]